MENLKFGKSVKKIVIPYGVEEIPARAFEDFTNLEEVILPSSVRKIGNNAFMGCKSLKRINLPDNLKRLGDSAFENCESLEDITTPYSLEIISPYTFRNCYNLKKINVLGELNFIGEYSFQNCKSLQNFNFKDGLIHIGSFAFFGCESIKKIYIPKSVINIKDGAFALMKSLEKIEVDKDNHRFSSDDKNTMLIQANNLLQYATNSNYNEVFLYYDSDYENNKENSVMSFNSICYIGPYAFAGAKNLKKLHLSTLIQEITNCSFINCENLKNLSIASCCGESYFLLNISNRIPFSDIKYHDFFNNIDFPFENVEIKNGVENISIGSFDDIYNSKFFKNAKKIKLPNSIKNIRVGLFKDSNKLEEINIPESVNKIQVDTFNENANLFFSKIGHIKGNKLKKIEKIDNITIIYLNDDTYYIVISGNDPIKTNYDKIFSLTNDELISKNPNSFIQYLIRILHFATKANSKLELLCKNEKLKELFITFKNDKSYAEEIENHNYCRAIEKIISIENNCINNLFSPTFIKNEEYIKDLNLIAENYNSLIEKFLNYKIENCDLKLFRVQDLIKYCNLLEKYKKYDKLLCYDLFLTIISTENQELLIKYFNKNIKRLIIKSNTIDSVYLFNTNLNDLINFCRALGVFSDNERLSQKVTTFIIEKLMDEKSDITLTRHNIHSIFDGIKPRNEIDYEFIEFFIDNYKELFDLEKNSSGIITKIYNNFRKISKTSASNRGNCRHLKVTIDKCIQYLALTVFDGTNEDNKDLAIFLQKYYCEPNTLKIAEQILEESKKAPRNIFTKVKYDKNNNPIYDYDSNNDLKEEINENYSFEWLPKQDWNNLILGKYCNCCAHIQGAGQGIMRASMILDNCQNLVVRDENGTIISKAIIYVNKEKGYAVFNTIETSLDHREKNKLNKIYKAILRGSKAFIEKYNENNKNNPIRTISVGTNRNTIINYLVNNHHRDISANKALNFGDYSLNENNRYNGDWQKQKLILKI